MRVRALFGDQAACAGLPNKGNRLDFGVFAQRFTRTFAKAVHRVQNTWWQARFFGNFDQQACSQWRCFGWFMNHGAPCGQGWCDLPCGQHERRVPRRDDTHRADRFARRNVY